jgi:hypothetical protein
MHLHVLCDIRRSIFRVMVFLLLRGLSLTLPRANSHFSQPSSVVLRGGALLNRSTERSHHSVHCLSCVLSLMHPTHFATKRSFDRVTACVSHTENTTKLCGCGISRMHYLGHCCQTAILHCIACCAVLYELKLSLRCVLCGCTGDLSPTLYISHLRMVVLNVKRY